MPDDRNTGRVTGKTIRLAWTEGPTKGATHEHVFNADGSVDYGKVENGASPAKMTREKKYAAVALTDSISLVSYLAASGFTLTVALDFDRRSVVGFASNDKQWFPVKGTLEVVR